MLAEVVEGEGHVAGGHGLAVVPARLRMQLELHGQAVFAFAPLARQGGHKMPLAVAPQQRVEHQHRQRVAHAVGRVGEGRGQAVVAPLVSDGDALDAPSARSRRGGLGQCGGQAAAQGGQQRQTKKAFFRS